MERVTASKARDEWADILNRVAYGGERIVVRRHHRDMAVLIGMEDARLLESLEDRLDVEAAKRALKEGGSLSVEEAAKELGL